MDCCIHSNVINDNGEGNTVCLDCGVILDIVYSYSSKYVNNQTQIESNIEQTETEYIRQRKEEVDLIKTLKDLWHFPKQVIADTIHMYLKILKKRKREKRMKNVFKKKIFAFCFYKSLLSHNCSKSIEEICLLFDIVNIKTFSQLGFEENIELNCNMNDFLTRFCTNLNFSFKEKQQINNYLNKIQSISNLQPKTICSIAILHYHYINGSNWNTRDIANNCEISYQSMIKNYKQWKFMFN